MGNDRDQVPGIREEEWLPPGVTMPPRNPIDALEPIVRHVAARTGREVDETAMAEARDYCEQPVEIAVPGVYSREQAQRMADHWRQGAGSEISAAWVATADLHEFPMAVPPHLMHLAAQFCVGIVESRPPNQRIGRAGSPYIDRWFLARKAQVPAVVNEYPTEQRTAGSMSSEIENLYLHAYHRGDADEPHDHPWPNASLVVRGWYRENIHDRDGRLLRTATRRPGDIVMRSAHSVHAILETSPDCLSLFATLRKERDWGFHTADGFVPWQEFRPGA